MANRGAIQKAAYTPELLEYAAKTGVDPKELQVALSMGLLTDPNLQKQYQQDPRTILGQKAVEVGTDTSPLKGGAAEGFARIAQAAIGGRLGRDQRAHYDTLQEAQNLAVQDAIRKRNGPPAVVGASPVETVAGAVTEGAVPGATVNPTVAPGGGGVSPSPASTRLTRGADYESYGSKAYEPLEEAAAKEFGIPVELLRTIRVSGEKSNASAVSSANARSVYQIIPGTAAGVKRNYGFDPLSSPQNAVRGAAAVLAENYKGAGGNIPETFARYHAGTEGVRGRVNRAYVARTTKAFNALKGGTPAETDPAAVATGGETAAAQDVSIPYAKVREAPTPVAAPERPKLPDRVRSARMALVDNLLGSDLAGLSPNLAMNAINQFLPEGLSEEQKSAEQARQDEVDFLKQEYTSKLGMSSAQANAAFEGQLRGAETDTAYNRSLDKSVFDDRLGDENKTAEWAHSDEQNRLNRIATIEAANARANAGANKPTKIGEKARSGWRELRTAKRDSDAAMAIVRDPSNAKHFGVTHGILNAIPFVGNQASQKYDPKGIAARAVIRNISNIIVHARAGASQTKMELSQLEQFVPNAGDSAKELEQKLIGLREFIDNTEQSYIEEYGPEAYVTPEAAAAAAETPTPTPTPSAPPPPRGPGNRPKLAPDAKGHRGTLKL